MYVFMLDGGANNLTIRNNIFWAYGGVNTGAGGQHHLYIFNNIFVGGSTSFPAFAGDIGNSTTGDSGDLLVDCDPPLQDTVPPPLDM